MTWDFLLLSNNLKPWHRSLAYFEVDLHQLLDTLSTEILIACIFAFLTRSKSFHVFISYFRIVIRLVIDFSGYIYKTL